MNRHLSPIVLAAAAVLAAAIVVISITPEGLADVRFRQFRDDASRFEGYADRAKREETLADWDSAIQNGREALKAEWERDAEFKVAAELSAGADTPENREKLTAAMEQARASWEGDFEAAEAGARGSWYARREGITRLGFDAQWLKDELVKSDTAVTGLAGQGKVDAWDTDISPDAGTVKGQWESSLGSLLESLRDKGDALDAESRKSYESELEKIERELRDRFRLEKNSLVYSHRNRIIWDSLVDHASLRYKSEAESASAIADEILAETRETLSKDEEKVLGAKTEGADAAPVADFSNLGSDWERQIRELLEKGLSRWQKAQEDLITRMTSWKQGSEEAYRDGNAAWQNAYERLFQAQKEWQGRIEKEIGEGIDAWQARDQELAQNLEQSKKDLDAYLATMKGQWEGHSSGLADTMMTGSRIYGEAVDNIEWLTQMAARYSKTGVYDMADPFSGVIDWTAWLAQQEKMKVRLEKDLGPWGSNPPLWVTVKFEEVTYQKDPNDDTKDRAAERYTVTLWRGIFNNNNEIRTWYNYITDDSPQDEKTPYLFYMREVDRWTAMRDAFDTLVGNAEAAAHDANMVGLDGPGFLRNTANLYGLNEMGKENDPYLMTRAEYEYELARREREYWNNRLQVAKDVLDYAYADGPRESAAATEERKSKAEAAMTAAKTVYKASLASITDINADLARIKGLQPADGLPTDSKEWIEWRASIEYLSGELAKQRGVLAKAEEEYQKYAQALIVLENGQDADFMRREIVSIQSSLVATEKALADKRGAYLASLTAAEGVDRMAAYAESANDLVYARMKSLREFDAFRAVVAGEESDAALDTWGTALLDDASAGTLWTGMEERRAYIASRYQAWKDAGDDEKDARKREFATAVRAEYLARERTSAAYGTMLGNFMDEDFDPGTYQASFNETYGESDRAVLLNYATLNEKTLKLVESAMKDSGTKNLDGILAKLPAPGNYTYGADNESYESFITKDAARRWVAEHFVDINEKTWDAYAGTLTKELKHAGALVEMYEDFSLFESDYQDLLAEALGGDASAQRLVAEYTESGSTLAIAPELAAYDGARERNHAIMTALVSFAAEKGDLFAFSDARARASDHEAAMIDYVNREIGGGFILNEDLSGLDAEGLAEAARLMAKYAGNASSYGAPVPAAMLKLAQELEMYAGDLEELLYVRDRADDLDFREVLAAREKGFAESGEAFSHVDQVEEVLSGQVVPADYGYGDGRYNILKSVLESRNAMSAGAGAFLASHDTGAAADYTSFLTGAASLLETFEIQHMALRYLDLGGGMTLDDYISSACTGRGDAFKEFLRNYITHNCLIDGNLPADPGLLAAMALGIGADIDTASSLMESEILYGRELMPSLMEELGAENDTRRREASRARRLVAYHDDPASFASYRNCLSAMTAGTDGATADLAVNQGPGFTGMDGRDGEGSLASMFFAAPDAGGQALGSMLIEVSNTLALRMGEMFTAARPVDAAGGELRTVEEYLTRLRGIFNPGTTYAYDNGYAFDGALEALLSEASTVKHDSGLESLAASEGEISSLSASLSDRKADIIQRASVFGVMGRDREELRLELERTGAVRNTLQIAYSNTARLLADAQRKYQAANGEYITRMNAVSTSYSAFQGAELSYERAYAVWEYANTPYLNDTAAREGGAGEGTLPGGETADLAAAPVPDAKERYARVKASFDAAEENMASKKTAMDAQETVAQLNADAEYGATRVEFKGEAESFARTARAADMIEEEIGELKAQVDLWSKQYTKAKENGAGLNKEWSSEPEDAEVVRAEKSQRDMILGRMVAYVNTPGNSVQSYIDIMIREHNLRGGIAFLSSSTNSTESWYDPARNSWHRNLAALQSDYENLTNAYPGIMADIEYLRIHDLNYSNLIEKMASEYYSYKSWYNKYEYANSKCGSKNPVTRRRWRNNRDHRRNEYRAHENLYNGQLSILSSYLSVIVESRNKLTSFDSQLTALDEVRSAKVFRATTLAKAKYALTTEDRERLYDALDGRTDPGAGDANINALRRKVQRKDIDGYAVQVKRSGDTLQVLDREGKVTGSYALGDTSVILTADEAGTLTLTHADLADGATAYLTDYVYSSLNVTRALQNMLEVRREKTKRELEKNIAAGTHDRTVVLRDLESLYHGLLLQAASVGTALPEDIREIKPRSYEGYAKAVADLVYNGSGTSVDDRIVKDLMAQNNSFQTQNWKFLTNTYSEKKQSWMETAAFIRTRGTRDWTDNLYAVENAWRKWSMEIRAAIAGGEEKWEKAQAALVAQQERWKAETAVDSADAAAEMLGRDLEGTIRASVEAINASLPKSLAISFDAESLYRDAMKNAPKADLGALAKSMLAANTTAGLTNLLDLGLSGNLAQSFEKQMQAFENGMSVMKNLRMSEVIYNMMDGFDAQLAEANEQNYDTVFTGLAVYYEAPFVRNAEGRQWNLRVVEDHSLTDTNYHTIRFADYQNYQNSTVKLKSLRSLNGGSIDFGDPATYNLIDARELEMYVRLETDHLNKEIEKVFGNGEQGLFSQHSKGEFDRLQGEFGSAYSDYLAGEAMMGGDWYRTPIFKGGPDPMTAAKIGACVAGPWAAFAVTAVMLAVDTKDGVIAGKHALMQGAVGFAAGMAGPGGIFVNIAASGIDYEANGSVGWDNDKFREGAIRNVASYALSSALGGAFNAENSTWGTGLSQGLSSGLMNGVQITSTDWGDLDLDYDKANWREHLVTGAASGIAAMVNKALSGKGNTGSERSSYGNENGTSSAPEMWGDASRMKVLTGGINSLLMTTAYHAMDGKGFKNDYSQMNWANMTYSAYDLGNMLGSEANTFIKDYAKNHTSKLGAIRNNAENTSFDGKRTPEYSPSLIDRGMQGLANLLNYAGKAEAAVKGFFGKIGAGIVKLAGDGIKTAWNGIVGLFKDDELPSVQTTRKYSPTSIVLRNIRSAADLKNAAEAEGKTVEEFTKELSTKGAKKLVEDNFKSIVEEAKAKDLHGEKKFEYVVNKLRDEFKDAAFLNQTHLAYTFAAVMTELGKEFDFREKDGVQYSTKVVPFNDKGELNKINKLSCDMFSNVGLYVLGLTPASSAANVWMKNDNMFKYDQALRNQSTLIPIETDNVWSMGEVGGGGYNIVKKIAPGGVLNMLSNTSLFEAVSSEDAKKIGLDRTGTIAVTMQQGTMNGWDGSGINAKWINFDYKYFDHVYVSTNADASKIAESSGRGGVESRRNLFYGERTEYYLRLKLNNNRKIIP
jgi:hypothetical protein